MTRGIGPRHRHAGRWGHICSRHARKEATGPRPTGYPRHSTHSRCSSTRIHCASQKSRMPPAESQASCPVQVCVALYLVFLLQRQRPARAPPRLRSRLYSRGLTVHCCSITCCSSTHQLQEPPVAILFQRPRGPPHPQMHGAETLNSGDGRSGFNLKSKTAAQKQSVGASLILKPILRAHEHKHGVTAGGRCRN